MNNALFKAMPCLIGAVGLIKAAPVLAQAAASGGDQLSEIVVTARRVEERAQDVSISMAVFNQQQLSTLSLLIKAIKTSFYPRPAYQGGDHA